MHETVQITNRISRLLVLFLIGFSVISSSCSIGNDERVDSAEANISELQETILELADSLSICQERLLTIENRLDGVDNSIAYEAGQQYIQQLALEENTYDSPSHQQADKPSIENRSSTQGSSLIYVGNWSDGSGHTLTITESSLSFSGDGLRISYRDLGAITDGFYFILEVENRPGGFFAPYLVLSIDQSTGDMHMKGYNSYDDAFMGRNPGLDWHWI